MICSAEIIDLNEMKNKNKFQFLLCVGFNNILSEIKYDDSQICNFIDWSAGKECLCFSKASTHNLFSDKHSSPLVNSAKDGKN